MTIAVERLAGALAAEGAALADVAALAGRVAEAGRSYGVALHEAEGEIELGVGIHGEPGRERRPHARMGEIAEAMVEAVSAELDGADRSLVLLSGLGGTPQLELYALYGQVERRLRDRGIEPVRTLVGDLITSLDQPGAVLSVVPLDEELERLWDAPLRTAALQW